jgi:predicted methyltransferase
MRHLASVLFALAIVAPASDAYSKSGSVIAKAVTDPARPAEHRKLDVLRKPADTLAFAGVRPGMAVGEFYPGGGYFTFMLSDVVGPSGHVFGIENDRWKEAVEANEKVVKAVKLKNVSIEARPFGTVDFPKPLDIAWVTQNYHDLKIAKYGPGGHAVDTVAFDRAVYKALKPGGIFFILDHQGPANLSAADIEKMHRINRDVVVREVTSAGFKLAAEVNFLRRPGDDHTKPIFDPSIRGHTDQYALKFVKPGR